MNALPPIPHIAADESPEEFLRLFTPEIRESFDHCDSYCGNQRVSEPLYSATIDEGPVRIIHADESSIEPVTWITRTMRGHSVKVRATPDMFAAKWIPVQGGTAIVVDWFFEIVAD
jgi:hypothetical protein